MKYHDPNLREALAAEYALGALQGRARRRFERSLQVDPALREVVSEWRARLEPLDALIPPVTPPARVWQSLEQRLGFAPPRRRFLSRLLLWQGAAVVATLAAVSIGVLSLMPQVNTSARPDTLVVVLEDSNTKPAFAVSWASYPTGQPRLRIRTLARPSVPADRSLQLWILPKNTGAPLPLVLVNTSQTQEVELPRNLSDAVNAAGGLAVSLEPKNGSPTGLPTGPILFQGKLVRL